MLAPGDPYVFTNQESIPPRLLKPALTLYRSWDMAESDGKWEDAFTEECTLIMGPTPSKGRKAIKAFRDASINATKGPIIDLEHQVDKYYVMSGSPEDDSGEVEIIMCGTIWYLLKSGKKIHEAWASRGRLVKEADGVTRFNDFQVYIDNVAMMAGMAEMMAAHA